MVVTASDCQLATNHQHRLLCSHLSSLDSELRPADGARWSVLGLLLQVMAEIKEKEEAAAATGAGAVGNGGDEKPPRPPSFVSTNDVLSAFVWKVRNPPPRHAPHPPACLPA